MRVLLCSRICLLKACLKFPTSRVINQTNSKIPTKRIGQVLKVTERQYAQMEYIIGDSKSKIINSEEIDCFMNINIKYLDNTLHLSSSYVTSLEIEIKIVF